MEIYSRFLGGLFCLNIHSTQAQIMLICVDYIHSTSASATVLSSHEFLLERRLHVPKNILTVLN